MSDKLIMICDGGEEIILPSKFKFTDFGIFNNAIIMSDDEDEDMKINIFTKFEIANNYFYNNVFDEQSYNMLNLMNYKYLYNDLLDYASKLYKTDNDIDTINNIINNNLFDDVDSIVLIIINKYKKIPISINDFRNINYDFSIKTINTLIFKDIYENPEINKLANNNNTYIKKIYITEENASNVYFLKYFENIKYVEFEKLTVDKKIINNYKIKNITDFVLDENCFLIKITNNKYIYIENYGNSFEITHIFNDDEFNILLNEAIDSVEKEI